MIFSWWSGFISAFRTLSLAVIFAPFHAERGRCWERNKNKRHLYYKRTAWVMRHVFIDVNKQRYLFLLLFLRPCFVWYWLQIQADSFKYSSVEVTLIWKVEQSFNHNWFRFESRIKNMTYIIVFITTKPSYETLGLHETRLFATSSFNWSRNDQIIILFQMPPVSDSLLITNSPHEVYFKYVRTLSPRIFILPSLWIIFPRQLVTNYSLKLFKLKVFIKIQRFWRFSAKLIKSLY